MNKRIVVFGCTGMLGSGIVSVLNGKCDLVLVVRDSSKLLQLNKKYGLHDKSIETYLFKDFKNALEFEREIGDADMVINCIGVLNRTLDGSGIKPEVYSNVNVRWPHILSERYEDRVVHVSTDCVFDGKAGPYDELSCTSPSYGMYGYSKLFGEAISTKSLVLRCCLLGESLEGRGTGLLDWARQQTGDIKGFSEQFVTPITSVEFGKICLNICNDSNFPRTGLFHIAADRHSKYEILEKYKKFKGLSYNLIKDNSSTFDKSLITNHTLLTVPSLDVMLSELTSYKDVP